MWRRILFIILIILLIIFLVLLYLSQNVQRHFANEVNIGIARTSTITESKLTEAEIANLPEPVKKYLKYVGVIGKEKVHSIKINSITDFNMGDGKGWSKMISEEWNFYDERLTRLAIMHLKTGGIPVVGLDSYKEKQGSMLMKPFGLFAVVDAKGHIEDDTSALVMLFLSMCANAPATLIDSRITWSPINDRQVEATLKDGDISVTAILDFNQEGELIQFSTYDKYLFVSEGKYEKIKWKAPLMEYKEMNGLILSTYGEAIWKNQQEMSVMVK